VFKGGFMRTIGAISLLSAVTAHMLFLKLSVTVRLSSMSAVLVHGMSLKFSLQAFSAVSLYSSVHALPLKGLICVFLFAMQIVNDNPQMVQLNVAGEPTLHSPRLPGRAFSYQP
jgi:hypothetical protein